MIYKMLAVNIDGTLLQSNGKISKAARDAIEYVHEKGVAVVLVTSRDIQVTKKLSRALKINPMIIASQGAFVGASIDKPLYVRKLDEKTTIEAVQVLEHANCRFQLNFEDSHVCNRVNLPENLISKVAIYVSEQAAFSNHYVDSVSGFLSEDPVAPLGIEAVFNNEEERDGTKAVLESMFSDLSVTVKEGSKLLIYHAYVGKWEGLRYLAEHNGVPIQQIVAVGDGLDDLEMIRKAGIGVAMGNAHPKLKKQADWLTRSHDDEGFSYMVKEIFRRQYQIRFLERMNLIKK
ncbi:MAG: HAD family hydrolase [Bacillus sp. (in: firmicutes)]